MAMARAVKRPRLSKFQKAIVQDMKAGYMLIRDTEGFHIHGRQLDKRTILAMLRARAIKPARDGAFGRSQTYLLAD